MRKLMMSAAAAVCVAMVVPSSAFGFSGGGRQPSEAPTIAWGAHYTGELNNHKVDSNYGCCEQVALYRLPPVSTRDVVVVNWHALPFTNSVGRFPICLALIQGVTDYTWASIYPSSYSCDSDGPQFGLSASGSAASQITIQNSDAGATYLAFNARSEYTTASLFETFPYDFAVEPPRHFLALALTPQTKIPSNGTVTGTLLNAVGLPAPDGMAVAMTVTWGRDGVASYSGTTLGGAFAIPLALPESAVGERATVTVARGPDPEYQAVTARMGVNVKAPSAAPAPAPKRGCGKAKSRAHVLARQLHRLQRHAARAQGYRAAELHRHAREVNGKLKRARQAAAALC